MEFFDLSSDSESSVSDYFSDSDDNFEEILLDRQRPKNENFIANTVQQYNDEEFIEHFRISRGMATLVAARFEESNLYNQESGGNGKLNAIEHVLIFCWFAGHEAASFRDVGDRFDITISSVFRVTRRLIYFLSNLAPQVISWPSLQEKREIETFFREKGFPGVIGAIDGSHVRIDKPSMDPESYYNRKKFYSIQLQAVCDNQRKIRSLFVGFPGSVHDARVFRRSPLSENLAEKCGNFFILGDGAYSCSRYLVCPLRDNGNLTARQRRFNQKLSSCRYVIEHSFGLLKQKFRQLYHCKLRSIPDIVNFIRACCVLHNLAIDDEFNVQEAQEHAPNQPLPDEDIADNELERDAPEGNAFRNYLLQILDL